MAVTEYIQKVKDTFKDVAVDGPKHLHYPEDALIDAFAMGFEKGKGEGKKEAETAVKEAKVHIIEKHRKDVEKMVSNLVAYTTSLISNNISIKSIYVRYYPDCTKAIFFVDETQLNDEQFMEVIDKQQLAYSKKSIDDGSFINFSLHPDKQNINYDLLIADGFINLPPLDTIS